MKILCYPLLAVLFLVPFHANAQEASSFEQLQVMLKPGDTVAVTDLQGNSNRGRILELSPSTLRLALNGIGEQLGGG